ncbi:MAG TPA: hypothetical protein VNJ54_07105 [Plantibacter sp.]|uniref:hypothetical protein n=1 Tax=unclassified Plantibacter TaxID=2624265 RepID=UPI002CEA1904|nr:hypothetical protein [Plantibacter sp.]
MNARLVLADAQSARDALHFAGRASRIGSDGVRLQASTGTLVISSAGLSPRGLFDRTPTVIALRVLRADPELECDLVVETLSATDAPAALALPASALAPPWAALALPRGGWMKRDELSSATLAARSRWGISAVAHALPDNPGEDVVRAVRGKVWGEPEDEFGGLPRGVSFVASAFGFLGDEPETAIVTVSGRWTRLTLERGHVLSLGPVASGLTEVRRTGARPRSAE